MGVLEAVWDIMEISKGLQYNQLGLRDQFQTNAGRLKQRFLKTTSQLASFAASCCSNFYF